MKLFGSLVPLAEVTPRQRQQMFELMDRHYAGVQRSAFEADLDEKQWVIQVFDPACGALCGFSTQTVLDAAADGRPIKALFSGDTIIDRAHWGDPALSHVWGRLALSLIDGWPDRELFWFLISQGYRTYRFLPVFFHEFYPAFDRPTPVWARHAIDALARHKFPRDYRPASGVIEAGSRQYRLRPQVGELTAERLRDPHVRFFSRAKPAARSGRRTVLYRAADASEFSPGRMAHDRARSRWR